MTNPNPQETQVANDEATAEVIDNRTDTDETTAGGTGNWVWGIVAALALGVIALIIAMAMHTCPDPSESEDFKALQTQVNELKESNTELEGKLKECEEAAAAEAEEANADTYRTVDLYATAHSRKVAKAYLNQLRAIITASQSDPEYVTFLKRGIHAIPDGQTGRLKKENDDVIREAKEAFDTVVDYKVEIYTKVYRQFNYPSPQELGYPTPEQFRYALETGDTIELPNSAFVSLESGSNPPYTFVK